MTARHRILANGTVQQERYHSGRSTWYSLGDVVMVDNRRGRPLISIYYSTKAGKPRFTTTTRARFLGWSRRKR